MSSKTATTARKRRGHVDSAPQTSDTRPPAPKRKKKNKVFGVMTKRRWLAVWVFLCGTLYIFTLGAPLSENHLQNLHWMAGDIYDHTTAHVEGDTKYATQLFGSTYFIHRFIMQLGAHFPQSQSPTYLPPNRVMFSDSVTGDIWSVDPSYTMSGSLKSVAEDLSGVKSKNPNKRQGVAGIVRAVTDSNQMELLVAQPSRNRIVAYNMETKKSRPYVTRYNGKALNGPWALQMDRFSAWVYFTDQKVHGSAIESKSDLPSAVYRFRPKQPNSVELVTSDIPNPLGLAVDASKNELYVTSCTEGQYQVTKLKGVRADNSDFSKVQSTVWTESTLQLTKDKYPNTILAGRKLAGCSSSIALHPDEKVAMVVLPGGRIAAVDKTNGKAKFVVKAADGVTFNDVEFSRWYLIATANNTLWKMKIQSALPMSSEERATYSTA